MSGITCFLCVDPCVFFGVFDCGHFSCGFCAIRIYSRNRKGCPVCRQDSKSLIVTSDTTYMIDEQRFDINLLQVKGSMITDNVFNVRVDGDDLAKYIRRMHDFLCPFPKCWKEGEQKPFVYKDGLIDHLIYDHNVDYCDICLIHRPAFLCEQTVYSRGQEMKSHFNGTCTAKDPLSFTGHPSCDFCQGSRFYDSDQLVSHMNHEHFRCHICDAIDAHTFVFFKDRQKLLNHFTKAHILCSHADCASLDPMCRVFRTEVELAAHTQQRHSNGRQQACAISLDSLGFVYGTSNTSMVRGGDSGRTGVVAVVEDDVYATGENQHSTRIIFNHVNTQNELILDISKRSAKDKKGKKSSNSNNSSNNNENQGGFISRLPKHYESKTGFIAPDLCVVEHIEEMADDLASEADKGLLVRNSNTNEGETVSNREDNVNSEKKRNKDELSATARVDRMSIKDAEIMKTLPTDERQLNRMLNEKIIEFFSKKGSRSGSRTSDHMLREFTQASQQFIEGKCFATEYYRIIESIFSGGDDDMMGDIFPLIAATVPNKRKQEALLTARRMLTCNELHQQERIRNEEKKKKEGDMQAAIIRSSRMSVLNKNKGKNKKNAWGLTDSCSNKPGTTVSVKSNNNKKKSNSDANTISQLIPGCDTSHHDLGSSGTVPVSYASASSAHPWPRPSQSSAALPAALHTDPSDFPALASTPPLHRRFGNKSSTAGNSNSSNPWFNRR